MNPERPSFWWYAKETGTFVAGCALIAFVVWRCS